MSKMIKTNNLLDLETGELIEGKAVYDPSKDYLINKKRQEDNKRIRERDRIIKEKKEKADKIESENITNEGFYMLATGKTKKSDDNIFERKIHGLTLNQEGHLIKILANHFVNSMQSLKVDINGKKVVLLNKHLEETLGVGKGRVSGLLKIFIEKKILERRKGKKGIFVNTVFYKKNIKANGEHVTRVYLDKLKEVITRIDTLDVDEKEKTNSIGLINRLGYMFHHRTYHLCSNPSVNIFENEKETVIEALKRNPRVIKYLGTREFLRALSDNGEKEVFRDTLEYRLHILLAAGVVTGTVGSNTTFRVHPDLMNRHFSNRQDSYTEYVRIDFLTTMDSGVRNLKKANQERRLVLRTKIDNKRARS